MFDFDVPTDGGEPVLADRGPLAFWDLTGIHGELWEDVLQWVRNCQKEYDAHGSNGEDDDSA